MVPGGGDTRRQPSSVSVQAARSPARRGVSGDPGRGERVHPQIVEPRGAMGGVGHVGGGAQDRRLVGIQAELFAHPVVVGDRPGGGDQVMALAVARRLAALVVHEKTQVVALPSRVRGVAQHAVRSQQLRDQIAAGAMRGEAPLPAQQLGRPR